MNTVIVHIFAQLNFRISSIGMHIRATDLFAHIPFNFICSIMIIIFAHTKCSGI